MFHFSKSTRTFIFPALLIALMLAPSGHLYGRSPSNSLASSNLQKHYGQIPLAFEPNQGQASADVRFVSRAQGLTVLLKDHAATLLLPGQLNASGARTDSTLRMEFPGAKFAGKPEAFDQQSGVSNYLLGKSESSWHTGIPNFSHVEYAGVYPGVDLVFYGNHKNLEHDFLVSPETDYHQIRVRIEGTEKLSLATDGSLTLTTASGTLVFHAPEIYQYRKDRKVAIAGRYVLTEDREFGFEIDRYDRSLPLVIDPVLGYSTYLAGSSSDTGAAIAVDNAGSAYVTGYTFSNDFPTLNPEQATCNSSCSQPDAFVTKFSADGSALVYSTYVGGSGYEQASSITVDSAGNALVAGFTTSFDFPQKNGLSVVLNANSDHGFAFSLNPSGAAFNFSTYLGGIGSDLATGIATDTTGNAYVTGFTNSPNFPLTLGNQIGPPPSYPNNDVFVTKLSGVGALVSSTLIGGNNPFGTFSFTRYPVAITVDTQGEALLAGAALDGFPTTPGSYQPAYPGAGNNSAFLALLNNTGSALLYATYLGGTGSDNAASQAVLDSLGDVYVTGTAGYSLDFPTTPGAFQTTNPSGTSASFVTKMNASLSTLTYSTYLAATQSNSGNGVTSTGLARDQQGDIYVVGYTNAPTFPLVNPLVATLPAGNFGNSNAAFLSVLNSSGSGLTFSTFLSGSVSAMGTGVAVDSTGSAYMTGSTYDPDFPTTPGAFQPKITQQQYSPSHAFVTKFDINTPNAGVCLSASSLFFGYVQPGKSSFPYPVTVTNCGTLSLQVSSVTTTSTAFIVTQNGCKKVLPGAACTVKVRFSPPIAGGYAGNLVFSDTAPITPQSVQLSGYTPTSLLTLNGNFSGFPDEIVGLTSPPVLTGAVNNGQFPIHITSVTADGDFAPINQCPAVLQPGQYCFVGATFTPTAAGARTGTIYVNDDALGSPQTISATGNGLTVYPTPSIDSISPTSAPAGSASLKVFLYGREIFQTTVATVNGKAIPSKLGQYGLEITLPAQLLKNPGSISLQVINPSPGGASNTFSFTVYSKVALQAADLMYEPFTQKLYASIPAAASTNPNSLVVIDPLTGTMGTPIPIGNDPHALGLSDDGTTLYVGLDGDSSVVPFNLRTQTIGAPILLGVDPLKGNLRAATIQVQPGQSSHFVATLNAGYNGTDGIALIENGTVVSEFLNEPPNNISLGGSRFVNATNLFSWNVTYGSWGLNHFVVSGKNLFESSGVTGTYGLAAFDSDGINLYDVNGQIFNATTGGLVGTIPQITGNPESTVLTDVSSGRLFFLGYFQQSVGVLVVDSKSLATVGGVNIGDFTSRLLHFGPDGLAFLTSNFSNTYDLITTRTNLFYPSAGPNPLPVAVSVTPAAVKSQGPNFLMTVSGSHFVRGAVVQWNGVNRTTKWVSPSKLVADIPASDIKAPGKAKITVLNPLPGGGRSLPLTITIQ